MGANCSERKTSNTHTTEFFQFRFRYMMRFTLVYCPLGSVGENLKGSFPWDRVRAEIVCVAHPFPEPESDPDPEPDLEMCERYKPLFAAVSRLTHVYVDYRSATLPGISFFLLWLGTC